MTNATPASVSKLTHSPGPWQHRHGAIIAADGRIVAQYFTAPDYQDASMIIAAPDMYKALKAAGQTVCRALCPTVKNAGEEWTHVERCKQITAALAKAEGCT